MNDTDFQEMLLNVRELDGDQIEELLAAVASQFAQCAEEFKADRVEHAYFRSVVSALATAQALVNSRGSN